MSSRADQEASRVDQEASRAAPEASRADPETSREAPNGGPAGPPPLGAMARARMLGSARNPLRWALPLIAVLAVFHTLHVAADLFIPITLAVLGRFTLSPVVQRLARLGLPTPLGAGLVVSGLGAAGFLTLQALSTPAAEWLERAPATLAQIEQKVRFMQRPVAEVVEATESVAEAASVGSEKETRVVAAGPSLLGTFIEKARLFVVTLLVTAALLFFFLASGDGLERKLSLTARRRHREPSHVRDLFRRFEADLSRYLLTITVVNAGLGCAVALALWILGVPSPGLWGVLAAVLNFVPYAGAAVTAAVLTGVSLVTFDEPLTTVFVTGTFLTLTSLEGLLITPALLGRRLTLGPPAIFVSVLVWTWLWGIVGAVIAVPLLTALRILGEYVDSMGGLVGLLARESAAEAEVL